jgi:Domain of unknown function (DUF4193)
MAKDTVGDVEEPVEEAVAEEELDDLEPTEADLESTAPPPAGEAEDVESIQDLLVKQESAVEEEAAEEEDEPILATLTRDERVEPLDTRVVPIQSTEFVCSNCFLVKHRSQLADKRKMLCRDCA